MSKREGGRGVRGGRRAGGAGRGGSPGLAAGGWVGVLRERGAWGRPGVWVGLGSAGAREAGHLCERGYARSDRDSEQGHLDEAQSETMRPAGVGQEAHSREQERSLGSQGTGGADTGLAPVAWRPGPARTQVRTETQRLGGTGVC